MLAFAFIFVFWISNFAGAEAYVVFDSSVAGLTSRSSVGLLGLKVGEVQSSRSTPRTPAKSTL